MTFRCEYDGKTVAEHDGPCMPEPYGPSSDFGWRACHGCEHSDDGYPGGTLNHGKDCTGKCERETCIPHAKGIMILREREDGVTGA